MKHKPLNIDEAASYLKLSRRVFLRLVVFCDIPSNKGTYYACHLDGVRAKEIAAVAGAGYLKERQREHNKSYYIDNITVLKKKRMKQRSRVRKERQAMYRKNASVMRRCAACPETKATSQYRSNISRRDGTCRNCKTCERKKGKLQRAAMPDYYVRKELERKFKNNGGISEEVVEQAVGALKTKRAFLQETRQLRKDGKGRCKICDKIKASEDFKKDNKKRPETICNQCVADKQRKGRKDLTDGAIRHNICTGTNIMHSDIPYVLVKAKRLFMQLKRAAKEREVSIHDK